MVKISSDSAVGMQFFFNDYYVPVGGELFFYDNNRFNKIGAFTHNNNRENRKFGTRPIFGDTIYLAYYVPSSVSANSSLIINRIVHVFDNKLFGGINFDTSYDYFSPSEASFCLKSVACLEEENLGGWEHEVKSVAMILFPYDGYYWGLCTGTLMNIIGGYAQFDNPYLLTCAHAIEYAPDPFAEVEDWVFLFGFEDSECGISNMNDQWLEPNNSVFGAELLAYDNYFETPENIVSDYLLCRLSEDFSTINNNIDVSYAGWDRFVTTPGQTAFGICFSHPGEASKQFSFSTNISECDFLTNWECGSYWFVDGNNWWEVNWDIGLVEGGASGAALFSSSHRVIGHLWGGSSGCWYYYDPPCGSESPDGSSGYGKFSTSWDHGNFQQYLNPYSMYVLSVQTFTPNFCGNGICEPENGEFYPDCPDCPDPNWGDGTGGSICWAPISDGFEINGSYDDVVKICPDYTDLVLTPIDDDCVFRIGKEILESDDSNCEWEESLYCWWTGALWWQKCECWHWAFYLSVNECDNNLNIVGDEFSGWIFQKQTSPLLLSISVLDEINQLGLDLEPGKYYRLQFASSPWGALWT